MARDDEDESMEDIDVEGKEESEAEYDENADEDFNPDKAVADDAESSSSEDDDDDQRPTRPIKKSKKRKSEGTVPGLEDLDSGDESTIEKRKSKKRRKDAVADEESGGEGGFIRTRAQRVAEKEERKHRKRARDGEVTVDVNQLWADLSSMPVGRAVVSAPCLEDEVMDVTPEDDKENTSAPPPDDEMITIKRRIEFAGTVEEFEETVPRSSKEAQRYLAEHPEADPSHRMHDVDSTGLQKPLKRPSMFEPNPLGLVKGVAADKLRPHAPTRLDVLMAQKREEAKRNAQKMSTVQKSALDWKGFVDQEGLRDELDEYGKSKTRFLAREAFLDRAAGAREQAARDARLKL